jgi:hypothetical protein
VFVPEPFESGNLYPENGIITYDFEARPAKPLKLKGIVSGITIATFEAITASNRSASRSEARNCVLTIVSIFLRGIRLFLQLMLSHRQPHSRLEGSAGVSRS